MEIKRGMRFTDRLGKKYVVANVFKEGENEVVTYRYYRKYSPRWIFETEFKALLLMSFDYGLFKWIK